MKRLMLYFTACFVLLCTALHAQDITGQWQGTLKLQQDVRIILVIAKDNGALKGTIYSYSVDDPRSLPLKASSISLDGSTFKFAFAPSGIEYEGKLSAEGNTITGTWTQTPPLGTSRGPTPYPLVLVRANKTTAWEIPALHGGPKMMPADADPSVEVATIKPNDSGATRNGGVTLKGDRSITARASSLEDLISFSYGVAPQQIVGGPSWMRSKRYDIVAVPDGEGYPNSEQERSMFRKLLADRFQLKFHKETRKMSAFVLTVDKGGAKIAHLQYQMPMSGFILGPAKGGLTIRVMNATIPGFASSLQRSVLDRPVVDHTGLQGKFDFTLTFLPDETQFNGHPPVVKVPDDVEPAPPLFEAMREQLGIKVNTEKTAVDVLAIDHVEKPSPN